jgi:NAD(P)H dehydrogenase (quinone)
MTGAVAEGAREAGAAVDIKRVPELVPAEIAKHSCYKFDQPAHVVRINELADRGAIVVGVVRPFCRVARWRIFSIRRAVFGSAARSTARSAAP